MYIVPYKLNIKCNKNSGLYQAARPAAWAGHSIYTKVSKIHYKCLDITESFK